MAERDPLLVRLLWWVIYMFLTGVSWTMIYYLMNFWNESIIHIEVDKTVGYKEMFPFPAVTVCSTTKIVADRSDRFHVSKVNQEYSNTSWDSQRSEILNNIKLVCDEYDRIGEANITSLEVIQILFQYLAPSMSDVIDSDETFTPIFTNHGLCFSNNMLDGREIFRENVIFYHNLNNLTDQEEKIKYYPKELSADYNLKFRVKSVPQGNEFKCRSEAFQFKVLLHNPEELPFMRDATTFLTDQFISISVRPEVISTDRDIDGLDPIERNCFFPEERNLSFFRKYTEGNCLIECLTNLTLTRCKCVTFYMPRLNTTEICSARLLNCIKVVEDLLPEHLEYCRCKPSCLTLSYNADIFTQHWPGFTDNSSNFTIKSSSEKYFVSYTRKNIYGINALISDVGGINGFFTGLTLSSIIKFVYIFIWKVIRHLFRIVRKLSKRK